MSCSFASVSAVRVMYTLSVPASFSAVLLPPVLLLVLLTAALAFCLPFFLTPADAISRRAIVLLSCLFCLQGGVLLAAAFLCCLSSALSLSASTQPPLGLFLLGLLSSPALERLLLTLAGCYVRRRRAREAEEAASAAETAAPQSASSSSARSRQPAAAASSSSLLLPPAVKDYRRKTPLDELSDEDAEFDYDDRDLLSPHHALYSSYGSQQDSALPSLTLDAGLLSPARYLSRCIFCKDEVRTRKAAAYHAAGCQLRHLHGFSISAHCLACVRGRRAVSFDDPRIPPSVLTCIALLHGCLLSCGLGAAASLCLLLPPPPQQQPGLSLPLPRLLSSTLTLLAFAFLLSFCTGLAVRQQRAGTGSAVLACVVSSCALPLSCLLSALLQPALGPLFAMPACAWSGGVLCWQAADLLMEEMERREARQCKWLCTAAGLLVISSITH